MYYKMSHVLESVRKIVSHHGWPTAKITKKHWIKRPKAVPKIRNLDQNINDSKSSILNFLFWKYYFGHTRFLYLSRRSSGHHQRFFLISRFSSRKSQSQQNPAKKITHFIIQFRSKDLTHFSNINSLDSENNMLSERK